MFPNRRDLETFLPGLQLFLKPCIFRKNYIEKALK